MNSQLIKLGLVGVSLYLISTGLSYAAFTAIGTTQPKEVPKLATPTSPTKQGHFVIDPSIPRTEVCPLNGQLYTKQEQTTWSTRRPLGVMIENHAESRPQSGLSLADVVYESVAEGGITRFLAMFYCGAAAQSINVAPVRSARIYFLPWVLEYDALYNHVGGAGTCDDPTVDDQAKALCRIGQWKVKDMDQFGISFPTCFRNYDRLDHPVATEHTMVCVTDKLYKLAADRGWTNVDQKNVSWDKNFRSWKFKDDDKQQGTVATISYSAWKGYEKEYGVQWNYDTKTNTYIRNNGGQEQKDLETDLPLAPKTVIVLFAKETGPVDDHAHLLYTNIGTGEALVFTDGNVTKATWKKADKSARTIFFDKAGKEISLNKGQVWISMLPIGTEVTY